MTVKVYKHLNNVYRTFTRYVYTFFLSISISILNVNAVNVDSHDTYMYDQCTYIYGGYIWRIYVYILSIGFLKGNVVNVGLRLHFYHNSPPYFIPVGFLKCSTLFLSMPRIFKGRY